MATYSLGSHFETYVRKAVQSGRYNNASEVVRDALRLHEEKGQARADLEALRHDIREGLEDLEAGRYRDYESAAALVNDIAGQR